MSRARVQYIGDEPITLPAGTGARPRTVHKGHVTEMDADAAKLYVSRPDFDATDEPATEPRKVIAEPVPQSTLDDLGDPSILRGSALRAALTTAGLPHTGTADEQRAALAAAQAGTDTSEGSDNG